MSRLAQTLSLAFMDAFAGGCLVVSVVGVPTWRRMDPEVFLDRFLEDGPRLGLTLFPLEAAGALFAVLAFVGALRKGSGGRPPWGLASLCIVATLVLLPAYFAEANSRMIGGSIEAPEVVAELERRASWQWLRTVLAVLAVSFGGWGLRRDQVKRERTDRGSAAAVVASGPVHVGARGTALADHPRSRSIQLRSVAIIWRLCSVLGYLGGSDACSCRHLEYLYESRTLRLDLRCEGGVIPTPKSPDRPIGSGRSRAYAYG